MFGWFKQKTLEQKVQIIKDYAKKKELSGSNANLIYVSLAIYEFDWPEVADHFMTLYVKETAEELT